MCVLGIQQQTEHLKVTQSCTALTASYFLFRAEFVKHVLNLQFPVLLQGVEGVLWHLLLHLLLQGHQLGQDGAKIWSAVGVLVPALCHIDGRYSQTPDSMPYHFSYTLSILGYYY